MKKITVLFTLMAVLSAPAVLLAANATTASNFWGGMESGTTAELVLVSPRSTSSRTTLYGFNVTSDKAASYLKMLAPDGTTTTDAEAAISQPNIPVAATTTFDVGDYITYKVNGTYYYSQVTSATAGVSLHTVSNLAVTIPNRTTITEMSTLVQWPVGAATKELYLASGIVAGPIGQPILFLLDATSAGTINAVSGKFE